MLRTAVFSLVASVLVPALAVQVPLVSNHRWQDEHSAILGGDDRTEWSLDKIPNPNATDHLVFETVHSLLQRWPNTRMRNGERSVCLYGFQYDVSSPGHNIVPGIIPKGTLFYHDASRKELPSGPEWVATDPEHSYIFCREASPQQGCWHLTLTTIRPLKVVYFDGNSAAKLPYGTLDSQNLIVWGESPPGSEWEETQRIEDLCKWGRNFGVDGFVR